MMKIVNSLTLLFFVFVFLFYSVVGHSNRSFSNKLEKYRSIESLNDEIEREILRRKINKELSRTKRDAEADKNKTSIKTLQFLNKKAHLKILTNGT